jgi:hypothetical protein
MSAVKLELLIGLLDPTQRFSLHLAFSAAIFEV